MGFCGSWGEGEPEAARGVKSVWNLVRKEWGKRPSIPALRDKLPDLETKWGGVVMPDSYLTPPGVHSAPTGCHSGVGPGNTVMREVQESLFPPSQGVLIEGH